MFNFLRRKPKEENKALHSLPSGAWSRILEPYAGAWQENVEVRLDSVLAYPAIFSCISLISSDIAKMPISVRRRQSNGVWVKGNNPDLSPLLIKPNFYQTPMQFFELWMISKLAHGNAYILKLRDGGGRVTQLRVLDPRRVIPYIADDGEIFYSVLTDELNGLQGGLFVPSRELIHDRFNTLFHPLCGLSPIYASGLAAIGGEAMLRNSAHTFKNGGKPGGIITVPGSVDADKAKEIKDNWNTGYSGANAGKTALLADGAAFVAVAQTATDSQLVEQLNLSNQLVAATFRVPLYKIDSGQTPSYNNIEALEQAYYSQCLQVHMTAIETLIADTFDLNEQTCVEFDHSRLLRMDTAARYKSYGDGIGAGFLAPNEARVKENMQPVEGGDLPYLQQQNYSLEALAKRDAQDDPFSTSSGSSPDTTPDPNADPNADTTPTPAADQNDPNQPPSTDDTRELNDLLTRPVPFLETPMITERERGFAEIIRQVIDKKIDESRELFQRELNDLVTEKDNIIDAQEEVIREDEEKVAALNKKVDDLSDIIKQQMERITDLEKDAVDESAIAAMVYAQIEVPDAPVLPDITQMVKDAISQIPIPQPEPLPDIYEMVLKAVRLAREDDLTPTDIAEIVKKAVDEIELPEPEPFIPPDINAIIDEVVANIVMPEAPVLPDIDEMVKNAVASIRLPVPEPMPDVKQLVERALSEMPLIEPEPLPDIEQMVKTAVSQISLPQPEPLPDIERLIALALSDIEIPQPEPLPDIASMVSEAVSQITLPQPEPLPDIERMVEIAVSHIELPDPEPLPDIKAMVSEAISMIPIPEAEPLPDIQKMVKDAISQIEIPEQEPLPDIDSMVKEAVSLIPLPQPEPLPDIQRMIDEVVSQIRLPEPEPLPDIQAMVSETIESMPDPMPELKQFLAEAVKQIEVPQPEPLPDIQKMIEEVVSNIEIPKQDVTADVERIAAEVVKVAVRSIKVPKPEPLPDIDKMVKDAVAAIELPQPKEPEPLPDFGFLIERAVAEYPLPEPEPLPDIEKMVKDAVAAIEIPQPKEPEPLPDIQAMIAGAVAGIEFPSPEPISLPDFDKMISEAVTNAVKSISLPEPGKGEDGKDGKDGLQIEVIPAIDTNKRYPRGTYAIHNGGLWRAYQNTSGLSGFECVVNGLNDIDIDVSDDRHFTVRMTKSNGETEERAFDIPVMIYRDVFKPEKTYYPGDCVTFAGSIWHCYEETSDRPNDVGSKGWRLAVKRGRDGRSRE
ncbi:phage portal protein [Pantoea sp. Al-1710]|uniref:Phage portal protein n=1 Tax=Candidatus Pantoea communis TaxID=2608354 RepID=A0ABX0RI18_9GAMM|nr:MULTISPECIES: phage portal protein [Pantoea]NIG13014.1 phage portal protein [Pantoea sp. Cy-640]NIG17285.1 phage portal protein [Pantoea communis]